MENNKADDDSTWGLMQLSLKNIQTRLFDEHVFSWELYGDWRHRALVSMHAELQGILNVRYGGEVFSQLRREYLADDRIF